MVPPAAARLWHGPSAVLARHDPGFAALRRGIRVTVAACAGFFVCHLVIGDDTMALYALFAVVALGALSEVLGSPNQRSGTYAVLLGVGAVLVTVGTLLAVTTLAAVAGMLVFGFGVAYAGVAGPRVACVANGLQLFYVLACFPPFAPGELGARLTGLVIGIVLLAVADRVLLPVPAPASPTRRFGAALTATARFATMLAADLRTSGGSNGLARGRADALAAADTLRMVNIPLPERPLGWGRRDRSLFVVGADARLAAARTAALADLLGATGPHLPHPGTADLLDASAGVLGGSARAVSGGPPPSLTALDATFETYRDHRARHLPLPDGPTVELRAGLTAAVVAQTARSVGLAAHGVAGVPVPDGPLPEELWFLRESRLRLAWRRLAHNFAPRSVYLQNAVRVALGLGVARLVAGVFPLSHGFWVLLATLSLMRTTAVASRSVLVKAFVGTLAGAVCAGLVLAYVPISAYAWVLAPLMIVAFVAGPVFGVAAGQGGFTLVVTVLFAQLSPTTWQLAEVRLIDVLVGGVVGTVIGAAVWPRGGGGDLRRLTGDALRAGADEMVHTIRLLVHATPQDRASELRRPSELHRLSVLLDNTFVQYRSEPAAPGRQPDWLTVLGVVHRLLAYAGTLRARHRTAGPLPWPQVAARLDAAGGEVALALRAAADAFEAGRTVPAATVTACHHAVTGQAPSDIADDVEAGLRVLDAWAWLVTTVDDLQALHDSAA